MSRKDDWSKQIDDLNKEYKMVAGNSNQKHGNKGKRNINKGKNKSKTKSPQKSRDKSELKFQMNLPNQGFNIYPDVGKLKIDNLYLLHHKYSLQYYDEEKHAQGEKVLDKPESFLKAIMFPSHGKIERNGRWVQNRIPRKSPHFEIDFKVDFKIDSDMDIEDTAKFELTNRTERLAIDCDIDDKPICFEFKLLDKLIIGMGGESPYDSLLLMTLHPLYGVPYLPATAIKGMLLSYFEQTEKLNQEERDMLFGSQENESKLIFFDIFPKKNKFKIDFDVLTPHYGDYYSGKGNVKPTDDQKTNIITFPFVKGASFDVYVAFRDGKAKGKYSDKISTGLKKAFQGCGIGAKTALGYGLGE